MEWFSSGYFIYLFGVLHRFQHYTGHITTGSWKGRGNQYTEFVFLYCKLLTNVKQLPAFPLEAVLGIEPRPQRWEARVLPLCHRGPSLLDTCTTLVFYFLVLYFFIIVTYVIHELFIRARNKFNVQPLRAYKPPHLQKL